MAKTNKNNCAHPYVPIEGKTEVVVEVFAEKDHVEAFHQLEISEKMWEVLKSGISDGVNLPKELQNELSNMKSDILRATRKVLTLIKYCFNQTDLDESLFSVRDTFWSIDKIEWKRLPMILCATAVIHDFVYLNENTTTIIQAFLEEDYEPFFALKHLHRAKKEKNPRYKWIDATIAAELAIKEFLIRKNPNLEPLLLEAPSPPLRKLYGSILESYAK